MQDEDVQDEDVQDEDARIEKEMKKVDAISRSIFMDEEKRFDYSMSKTPRCTVLVPRSPFCAALPNNQF